MADNKKILDLNGLGYVIRKMDTKKADIESPAFTGTPTINNLDIITVANAATNDEIIALFEGLIGGDDNPPEVIINSITRTYSIIKNQIFYGREDLTSLNGKSGDQLKLTVTGFNSENNMNVSILDANENKITELNKYNDSITIKGDGDYTVTLLGTLDGAGLYHNKTTEEDFSFTIKYEIIPAKNDTPITSGEYYPSYVKGNWISVLSDNSLIPIIYSSQLSEGLTLSKGLSIPGITDNVLIEKNSKISILRQTSDWYIARLIICYFEDDGKLTVSDNDNEVKIYGASSIEQRDSGVWSAQEINITPEKNCYIGLMIQKSTESELSDEDIQSLNNNSPYKIIIG